MFLWVPFKNSNKFLFWYVLILSIRRRNNIWRERSNHQGISKYDWALTLSKDELICLLHPKNPLKNCRHHFAPLGRFHIFLKIDCKKIFWVSSTYLLKSMYYLPLYISITKWMMKYVVYSFVLWFRPHFFPDRIPPPGDRLNIKVILLLQILSPFYIFFPSIYASKTYFVI